MRSLFFISTSLFASLSDKCRLLNNHNNKKKKKEEKKKEENLGTGSGEVPGEFECTVMANLAPHSKKRLVRRACLVFFSVCV